MLGVAVGGLVGYGAGRASTPLAVPPIHGIRPVTPLPAPTPRKERLDVRTDLPTDALRRQAEVYWGGSRHPEAKVTLDALVQRYRAASDQEGIGWSLYLRAYVNEHRNHPGAADVDRLASREAYRLAISNATSAVQRRKHEEGYAGLLSGLRTTLARQGRYQEALAASEERLAIHQKYGSEHGIAVAHQEIGYALRDLGRHDEAAERDLRAAALYRTLGNRAGVTANEEAAAAATRRAARSTDR
jgi:tetratricopeptide (TPR) repeat protein